MVQSTPPTSTGPGPVTPATVYDQGANYDGSRANESFITGASASHLGWRSTPGTSTGPTTNRIMIGAPTATARGEPEFQYWRRRPRGWRSAPVTLHWANSKNSLIANDRRAATASFWPGVNQSFITGADGPEGVAVDAGHKYWANPNANKIGSKPTATARG